MGAVKSNPSGEIAYANRDGTLVHISQVPRGRACDCICPTCNAPLIARKGSERVHHFAHLPGALCLGAAETVLHILGKTILTELDSIQIPPYNFNRTLRRFIGSTLVSHQEVIARGGKLAIDSVELEKKLVGFRPDAILFRRDKRLLVEIAVTHKVGKKKRRRLSKQDHPAIEINFSAEMAMWPKEKVKYFIQNDLDAKKWLFHPKEVEAHRHFREKVRQRINEYRTEMLKSPVRKTQFQLVPNFSSEKTINYDDDKRHKQEAVIQKFFRIHGRFPSIEETLSNWPELFKVDS